MGQLKHNNLNTKQQQFRQAMALCAAGVHVITTDGKAGRYGITMTAVAPITDTPPTLILCVNREASIYPILLANQQLCVNTLSARQQDIAEHFAGITRLTPEERFEQHIWHRGQTGQLQVEGALAYLHGTIVQHSEVGTHGVLMVQLDEIKVKDNAMPALVYFRRQFGYLA